MENSEEPLGKDWERRFGRRLKDLRTAKGWTQDDLAKRMTAAGHPLHQTTVAKIESGNRPTPVGEIAVLAAILDAPIAMMFSPDEEVEQMLLKLSAAAAEMNNIMRELIGILKAKKEIHRRREAAALRYVTLLEAAREIPELEREGWLPGPSAELLFELSELEDRRGEHQQAG